MAKECSYGARTQPPLRRNQFGLALSGVSADAELLGSFLQFGHCPIVVGARFTALASDVDLVTMGRSFHWMDREQVLTALDGMVDNDGGLVIANDSCLIRSATTWQQAIEDIQQRFLPPDWQTGIPTCADGHEPHEEILARSAFRHVQQRAYQFTRTWTIEQAIGYLYSTSMPLHRLLGSRRAAFEQEVTDTLLAIDPAGRFTEPVTLEVLTATTR